MKKCILIYDDSQDILLLCKAILEATNYQIETMLQCENIIADIDLIKPDLILMDLWIPKIGGENAVRLVKSDPVAGHIPIILFSADSEIEKITLKVKANGYLKKPFDINTLKEIIKNHLQN